MDQLKEKFVLEDQFILRLPPDEAQRIREHLHQKPDKIKKLLKINLDADSKKVVFHVGKTKLHGTVKKLPTIVESYKTNICNNKSTMFKTADICHIAECRYDEVEEKTETNHGVCPPLKNVKSKRFRKTMYNEDFAIEAERVSKELYYLLSTDLEATSSRFEILFEGNTEQPNQLNDSETSLFGTLSSDSEVEKYFYRI